MILLRVEDHTVGLELQLEELVEQRRRAEVQGCVGDVARLEREIAAVVDELAAVSELPPGSNIVASDPPLGRGAPARERRRRHH